MNYFIEIDPNIRKDKDDFILTSKKVDSMISEKLSSSDNFNCAICDELLNDSLKTAYRLYLNEKKLLAHPVHTNCIKDNATIEDMFSTSIKYADISASDCSAILYSIDLLKKLDK